MSAPRTDRRDFLKTLGGAAAGSLLALHYGSAGAQTPPPMKSI